jgi:hypothetical protein
VLPARRRTHSTFFFEQKDINHTRMRQKLGSFVKTTKGRNREHYIPCSHCLPVLVTSDTDRQESEELNPAEVPIYGLDDRGSVRGHTSLFAYSSYTEPG